MNYREPMTAKPLTSPFHCAVKGWDAKRKKNCGGLMSQCYDSVLQTATLWLHGNCDILMFGNCKT